MITVGGREYLTGVEIAERWSDVTTAMLRRWSASTPYRGPLVHPLTRGQLAAATRLPLPPGEDPDAWVRVKQGRGRPANLYPWDEVAAVELATRDTPEARRRHQS